MAEAPRRSKGRILVVDDEATLARAYARTLSAAGYEVEMAEDGNAALVIFRKGGISAVLTDITMPGMDGLALLGQIRQADADVPVVLATGGPTVESAIQALDQGALKYLVKPIDAESLLEVMEQAAQLSKMAEMRRLAAKLAGDVNARLGDRKVLEDAFDRAIHELFMVYQPIVRWSDKSVYSYEALVRSRESALPHPGALFEAAEKLMRTDDLGRAIRSIAPAPFAHEHLLFLNLHPTDLSDESLYDRSSPLCAIADRVVLEITERASLDAVPEARARIAKLRELGFRIAVDDLGAGYAGLTSFALLEPEVAKLDMTIVRDVHRIGTKQKLVHSMAELCKDMGILLIAEGVETDEEREALVDLGCDLLQGYLFARPGPAFPAISWGQAPPA